VVVGGAEKRSVSMLNSQTGRFKRASPLGSITVWADVLFAAAVGNSRAEAVASIYSI
jgi:hypothetical protein